MNTNLKESLREGHNAPPSILNSYKYLLNAGQSHEGFDEIWAHRDRVHSSPTVYQELPNWNLARNLFGQFPPQPGFEWRIR